MNQNKNNKRKSLLDNNTFAKVFSVCVALLCWLAVAMMNISDYKEVVRDIPVNIASVTEALAELDLNIIEVIPDVVSAEVAGERGTVSMLRPEDLTTTIQIPADLVEANVYDLRLELVNPAETYRVENYSPRQVRVRIDRLGRGTFDIEPQATGATTSAGYIMEEEIVTPEAIEVTGPQTELDKIAKAVISAEVNRELEGTYADEFPIVLLDVQGREINLEEQHLTLSQETAQLILPVLREKELPLEVQLSHVPEGFPTDELVYSMSNYEVMVAGPVDTIARYQEISLAPIDLRKVSIDNNIFTFDVEMPATGIVNLNNITSVTVTFPTAGLGEAVFNLSEVEMLHEPSRYEVSLLSEEIPNVLLCGRGEILESMSAEDLIAQVDLSERQLTPGQYQYPVKISAPGKGLIWPVGEYFVVLQVEERGESVE